MGDSLPGTALVMPGEFHFWPTEKVSYGVGAVAELKGEVDRLRAKRVLLFTTRSLSDPHPLFQRVNEALGDRLAAVVTASAHTPLQTVIASAELARRMDADLLVSLGGGSVIDTVKGVLLCLATGVRDAEQLKSLRIQTVDGKRWEPPVTGQAPPHIAIATTLSAAEFSSLGGITDPERRVKDLYTARQMAARVVIVDPEMLAFTPEWLLLSTGIRSLDHAVETVCSRSAQPYTDALALHAIRLLAGHLPAVRTQPPDLQGRLQCQFGAWLSISSLGRVEWGASHGIGHQLGAVAGVPHGYCSCIMLPHVMRFNRAVTAEKQVLIADALGLDVRRMTKDEAARAAADAIANIVRRLGLPGRLRDTDVKREQFAAIARGSLTNMMVASNPRPIAGEADILTLLEEAW